MKPKCKWKLALFFSNALVRQLLIGTRRPEGCKHNVSVRCLHYRAVGATGPFARQHWHRRRYSSTFRRQVYHVLTFPPKFWEKTNASPARWTHNLPTRSGFNIHHFDHGAYSLVSAHDMYLDFKIHIKIGPVKKWPPHKHTTHVHRFRNSIHKCVLTGSKLTAQNKVRVTAQSSQKGTTTTVAAMEINRNTRISRGLLTLFTRVMVWWLCPINISKRHYTSS